MKEINGKSGLTDTFHIVIWSRSAYFQYIGEKGLFRYWFESHRLRQISDPESLIYKAFRIFLSYESLVDHKYDHKYGKRTWVIQKSGKN